MYGTYDVGNHFEHNFLFYLSVMLEADPSLKKVALKIAN